jgi:hypothetical protein
MFANLFICFIVALAFLFGAIIIGGSATIAGIGVMRVWDRQGKRRRLAVVRGG